MAPSESICRHKQACKYDPSKPLISIHVPKSGGSTVREHLQAWFGENLREHYFLEASNTAPCRWQPEPGMCIHGHFNNCRGFGVSDYYPNADQFITFLRDPFELHCSLYFYLKQHQGSYYREGHLYRVQDEFPDLSSFIENICKNRKHPLALSLFDYLPTDLGCDHNPLRLFQTFLHVGVTAKLDESMVILAEKMGMPLLGRRFLNAAPRDEFVDRESLQLLHQRHYAADHAIYQQALEIHNISLASLSGQELPLGK